MPRIRLASPAIAPEIDAELTERLANEIRQRSDDGPLIYEQEIAGTDTYHVIVVWERWAEVPEELRHSMILEAYAQADPDIASKITICVGVTMEEAIDLTLLPYQIIVSHRQGDSITPEQLRDAMKSEGAVFAAGGWQLRFPTKELADETLLRLRKALPGDWWGMQRDVG